MPSSSSRVVSVPNPCGAVSTGPVLYALPLAVLFGLCLFFASTFWALAAAVFTPSAQPTGWLTRPALSSYSLASGNEILYRTDYQAGEWFGALKATRMDANGNATGDVPWSETDAAILLDEQVSTVGGVQGYDARRIIVTVKDDLAKTRIPFRWASLSAAQQAFLGTSTLGPGILNYVRGDRSNEGANTGQFRPRTRVLGDILHSTLIHWSHGNGIKRLYVGANDGMLHVFDALTGREVFAYIPSMVISSLKYLKDAPYAHRFFVDGPMSMAEVSIGGSARTLLVGGLGAGGRGLYLLDLTSTDATNEDTVKEKIKWEITSASTGFANLGYTYSMPRFARVMVGTTSTPVVIVGNGYLSGGGSLASSLYVINADTGALIKEVATQASPSGTGGLSSPALLDSNRDGIVDYAYAGDIDGRLWKFNLTGTNPAQYSATLLFTTSPTQAITVPPVLQPHPNGGQMVIFGTGRMLTASDATNNAAHYVYGVWDGAPGANTELLGQTLTETSYGGRRLRYASANTPDWTPWTSGTPHHNGWRLSLPVSGERVLGESPLINDDRYYFLSTNPTVTATSPSPSGENWLNEVNALTGGNHAASIFDVNGDGSISAADRVNSQIIMGKRIASGVASQPVLADLAVLSQTYFNTNPDQSSAPSGTNNFGVSGGHFDFDIFYGTEQTNYAAGGNCATKTLAACPNTNLITVPGLAPNYCKTGNGFPSGYDYATAKARGSCNNNKIGQLTCCTHTTSYSQSNWKGMNHVHEYDDKYDVVGVNMLAASAAAFDLDNAIPAADKTFRILVMNQYLNPAALLSIGGTDYTSVKTYGSITFITDPALLLTSLPTYSRDSTPTSLLSFAWRLPLDGFASKDWWGDGSGVRAGLIPTQTGCVQAGTPGPNGERYNGALTWQVIRANTPASALEMNDAAGGAKYGWRVKASEFSKWVMVEYTAFWHHPNGKCYGAAGWIRNPPQDFTSDAARLNAAAGSADPRDGEFGFSGGSGTKITAITTATSGNTTVVTTTYSDGTTMTRATTNNGDGTETVVITSRSGVTQTTTRNIGGDVAEGEQERSGTSRRTSWREIVRP